MPRSGWLAVGSVAAASASPLLGWALAVALVALGGATIILAGRRQGISRRADRIGTLVLVGSATILLRLFVGGETVAMGPSVVPDGSGPRTYDVVSVGAPRDGQQTATLRAIAGDPTAGIDRQRVDEGPEGLGWLVAATLPAYPAIGPGDRVTLEGAIRPRPDSAYGEYLERIGAIGTLRAREIVLEAAPVDSWRAVEDLRQGAAATLTAVLPEPEAGLAAGILIGLRDRVDRDLAAAFTTAGVSHVVAISGWNIAIVAAVVAALFRSLRRRHRSVLTMVVIVAYVAFAGASPSVVRAGAMAGVVLLARESGRSGRAAAALGWAATLLLLADPGLVRDAGFQLSTLATAGLIAWGTPMTEWFARIGGGRLPRWLAESLGISMAAQAATLPIVLASFGRLAVLSPLVNLAVVPLVAPAMAAGLLAMLGGGLVQLGGPQLLGSVLAMPGWVSLRAMVWIVDSLAGLPFASVTLLPPWDAVAALVAMGAVGLAHWRWSRRVPSSSDAASAAPLRAAPALPRPDVRGPLPRIAVVGLVVLVALGGAVLLHRPTSVPRVSILDVGQGDAILVEGSRGGRLLIDGGPDPGRLLVALDERIPPWDRRIDAVILSHPHEDHVAGLPRLLERYRVARVFEPGMRGSGPGYTAWMAALGRTGAPVRAGLSAGDRLSVDEIDLQVLWPLRGSVPAEPADTGTGMNNVSIVLLGAIGPSRVLLAGDVEEAIDPSLLEARLPRLDLLKVAHHGSRTATTQAFVAAVRPRVAVASAGAGNPYGHPARATMDRLAASGARVLRTDRDGTVTASFTPSGMVVRTDGGRSTRRPVGVAGPGVPGTTIGAVPGRGTSLGYHRARDQPPCGDRPPAPIAVDAGRAPAVPVG